MPRQPASPGPATPELIAQAALQLIDEEGPHSLSFRSLADRLGVSHMTIHRRCGDLDGLLDLCVDHLAGQLPDIEPGVDWAQATEARFGSFYELLAAHRGLAALRGARPWLGPQILARLVEPALRDNLAVGMSPHEAIRAYRRMYLLTLGCSTFVDHQDPRAATAATRTALAGLDPEQFPTLTGNMEDVLSAMTDHEVYYGALRQLIAAAHP
ncbi:TetR/AcrR family transcriptional regulator [Streptomyces syringium]|uniref:TetR/AcrR family transcriptional regulator n=1 Tax=Streptomyces syringium TaxID=76729 RepID=UPI0034553CED